MKIVIIATVYLGMLGMLVTGTLAVFELVTGHIVTDKDLGEIFDAALWCAMVGMVFTLWIERYDKK